MSPSPREWLAAGVGGHGIRHLPVSLVLAMFFGTWIALLAFAFNAAISRPATAVEPLVEPPLALTISEAPTPSLNYKRRTSETLGVMLGPGVKYAILGSLPKGAPVAELGTDLTGTWLAIEFPLNSRGRGWIQAGATSTSVELEMPPVPEFPTSQVLGARTDPPLMKSPPPDSDRALLTFAAVAAAGIPLLGASLLWRWYAAGSPTLPQAAGVTDPELPLTIPAEIPIARPLTSINEEDLATMNNTEFNESSHRLDQMLQERVQEFSQAASELSARVSGSLDGLRQVFAAIAEEQRALLRRQEELLSNARNANEEARSHAESAALASRNAAAAHDQALVVVSSLAGDRDSLTQLLNDLRSRIAALSVLAAPLPQAPSAAESSQPVAPSQPQSSEDASTSQRQPVAHEDPHGYEQWGH